MSYKPTFLLLTAQSNRAAIKRMVIRLIDEVKNNAFISPVNHKIFCECLINDLLRILTFIHDDED